VDADTAILIGATDLSGDGLVAAGPTFMEMLERLSQDGPPDRMLADMRTLRSRQMRDPLAAPGVAWSAALAALTQTEILTFEEAEERLDAVTGPEIAQVMADYKGSLVLGLPRESRWPADLHELGPRQWVPLEGGQPFAHVDGDTTVRLAGHAVQIMSGGRSVTVPIADVAGLMTFPDGARNLISVEGWSIAVEPNLYRQGRRLVEHIDAAVPLEKHLPQQARDTTDIPQRPPLWKRTLASARRRVPEVHWGWVLFAIWLMLMVGRALGRQ
jgi:hypothetical protein